MAPGDYAVGNLSSIIERLMMNDPNQVRCTGWPALLCCVCVTLLLDSRDLRDVACALGPARTTADCQDGVGQLDAVRTDRRRLR